MVYPLMETNVMANYKKIWETFNNSKLPNNVEIHHIDGNHDNNDPANLMACTMQEHYDIHKSQGDYGACQAILIRMNDYNKSILSELAKKSQKKLWKENRHNFQKISKEKRQKTSQNVGYKTLKMGVGIHAINADPEKAKKNAQNGGLASKEKCAGFLNTNSESHGSKAVKGTVWWTNIETKERKRSKEKPGNTWKRGMS